MEKEKNNSKTKKALPAPNKLKILVTVVPRSKTEFYIDVLENFEINMQTVIYGLGTAGGKYDYLGFNDNNKGVIISVVKESKIKDILYTLNDKFERIRHGKGIAYTIPISSVIGVMVYQFLSNNTQQLNKGE